MPSSLLFAINNEGRVFGLSTNGTKWREFIYLGLEFKQLSAVPNFLWAIGGDRQVYVHVHGLDIPIRIKEEAYENERWTPFEGFSKRLLPTDRYHFSNQDGSKDRTLKKIKLPSMAWQWEGDWHLELSFEGQPLDDDGWTYAVDFPGTYYAKKQWSSYVRRRKWVRYRKYSAINSWCAIAPLHKDPTREPFIGVAVGGNELPGGKPGIMLVWAVTAHGRVMFRTEVSSTSPEGQRWSSIPTPSGCEVSQISVGPTGLVWGVLWNGKALVRLGVTRDCLTGETWEQIDPPEDGLLLNQVSVGYNGIWAITRDNRVWFRKGINGDNCGISADLAKGTGWVEMIGNMSSISVASNDQVWAIGTNDRLLYFRMGVTSDDLTGKTWRLMGAATQFSRTSSSASLFSDGQSGASSKEKRHRSWTSLNRHSNSHENQLRPEYDLNETCHSAPAVSRNIWQKSSDGSSFQSFESHLSSDSGGIQCSLQESSNNLNELPHPNEIIEEKTKEEERENNVYENSSHPVMGFTSKEISRPTRSWSPQSSGGTIVGTEAHNETDSIVFESDELAGIYSEHGEREEEDDDLYWTDSEAFWAAVESGACHVDPNHLPNWFTENTNPQKLDLIKPWRVKILDKLKRRSITELNDLEKYEKAIDTCSWIKTGNEKCLLSNSTFYQDCVLELEWVSGEKGVSDCGTLTISSPDKVNCLDQISMNNVTGIVCSSIPGNPRVAIFKSNENVPVQIQFKAENDLEDWMTELRSVCCRIRNIANIPGPDSIWMTTALGDIFVCDLNHLKVEQSNGIEICSVELPLTNPVVPFESPLYSSFLPGSSITIYGCIPVKADRFIIDFKCCNDNGRSDIAFHFNPRFGEDVVVRNARKNGNWGPEDRRGCQPFKTGGVFEMKISAEKDFFKIIIDNKNFVNFMLRESYSEEENLKLTFPYISHLSISGDVVVNKIVYSSQNAILSPSNMYWRQIEGHLRKIESVEGITWGIGFDNTAWVYAGRLGTNLIAGLFQFENQHFEKNYNKNYKMNDSHCYYVYENQRWNPLIGYTSHGLPTDRFMWSDATGKHKRKREKIKLLSNKWHWVNSWSIDYFTPGGTDSEGWQYAFDFPYTYHGTKYITDYVRRRRWVRKAKLVTEGPWLELGHTLLSDCSLHSQGDQIMAWAVAVNGCVLYRRGVSAACPAGLSWEHVPSDHQVISISSTSGQVWAINKNGAAMWRIGITPTNPLGKAWNTVESPHGTTLKQISVGKVGIWVLDSNGRISVRRDVTESFPEGTHWETLPLFSTESVFQADNMYYKLIPEEYGLSNIPLTGATGGFRYISAKSRLWAITNTGRLVFRTGISPQNPSGSIWISSIDANCLHVSC